MHRLAILTAVTFLLTAPSRAPAQVGADEGQVPILIETELGSIEAVLDSARAPVTVTNFLRYVDAGLFDNARFFRSVRMDNQPDDSIKIEVIQLAISRENGRREFPPSPWNAPASRVSATWTGPCPWPGRGPTRARPVSSS